MTYVPKIRLVDGGDAIEMVKADGAVLKLTAAQFADALDDTDTAAIADGAVTAAKLATDAVETAKIKNLNVTAAKLAADAVETAKIKDLNVTEGKLAAAAAVKLNKGDTAVQKVINTASLAELNAGKVLLADAAGVTLTPVRILVKSTGAFADGTSIELTDNNGTPVVIASFAQAQLTDGAVLLENSTGVTLGAGFLTALTAGKGLKASATGTFTGGTSITFVVEYTAATA
jgi:hypothetical protein